jgi:murein DD-endopeptidase MepM/ murein hydrolase activator NlpD
MLNAILSAKDYFIPMDVVLAGGKHFDSPCKMNRECKEAPTIANSASGTWKNQFIPCKPGEAKGNDCAHLEVRRRGGILAQRNNRWMSGLNKVKAGNWLCFKEPTGRYPFGRNPKLVAEELKENGGKNKKAQVTFALYFSVKGPHGLRSAACFGPVPMPFFGTRSEGDLIIFGLDRPSTTSPLAGLIAGVQNPGQAAACSSSSSGGTGAGQNPQYQNASQSDLVPVATAPYLGRTEYLHRDAAAAFEEMLNAAKSAGINLYALSGYRSTSTQQQVLAANPGSTQIAQPGQSEHHTGYAVDIGNGDRSTDLNQSFEATDAYKWLNTNAAKYGFVQSYKTGSQYGNEPWHWRWQGNSTAQQLFNPTGAAPPGGQSNSNCNNQQNLPVPVDCQGTQSSYIRPSNGVVTSEFGPRQNPVTGLWRPHDGIDISGGFGTPILASNCGVVVSAGSNAGYGNDVCIKHSPTMTTCYSHLESFSVRAGDTVKKGQVIGSEGSTGQSTGPHLHFTVLVNGTPENPRNYVPI